MWLHSLDLFLLFSDIADTYSAALMFDDDDDDDFFDSNFNLWFDSVESDLPNELATKPKDHVSDLLSFYRIYQAIIGPLTQGIYRMQQNQYPRFKEETRSNVTGKLAEFAQDTASAFLLNLFRLVYNQRCGINVREQYRYFDDYVKRYGRPEQPQFLGNEYRHAAPHLTDEEWAERLRGINIEIQQEFEEENTPKVEFIDLLQSFVIGGYRALEELNPDEWIVYASILHNTYRQYLDRCWLIDSFIAYDLPESDLFLSDLDLESKIVALREEELTKQQSEREEQKNSPS